MNTKTTLVFKETIAAEPAHVYRAFSRSQGVQEWMADSADADGREGGRFYAWWNGGFYAVGVFKEAVKDKKVVFSWHARFEPAPTEVMVELAPSEAGTALTLTHSGLGEGDEWVPVAENFEREWTGSLGNLKSVLETGVDQRLYSRPMLGFYIGGLVDAAAKERLGLPIDFGMHVSGVLEGMGAQRSGLQANDVIATVEGVEVRDFQSLGPVLSAHKGGDIVKAVVYRGPEKIELDIELSRRPIPEFPPPPEELAKAARKTYDEMLVLLKDALKGVSETEAAHHPAPGEWNVKETLAHLLINERWNYEAWDRHPDGDKFPPFPGSARLAQAIAESYKVKKLYKEIKRTMAVNVRMIELLPEDYAANKAAYFITANSLEDGIRTHFNEHVNQIKTAVEAARKSHPQ